MAPRLHKLPPTILVPVESVTDAVAEAELVLELQKKAAIYELEIARMKDEQEIQNKKHELELKMQENRLSGQKVFLVFTMIFYGVAFLFVAAMLAGSALGKLTIATQVQLLLVSAIIATIGSLIYMVAKYYHPQSATEDKTEDAPGPEQGETEQDSGTGE